MTDPSDTPINVPLSSVTVGEPGDAPEIAEATNEKRSKESPSVAMTL